MTGIRPAGSFECGTCGDRDGAHNPSCPDQYPDGPYDNPDGSLFNFWDVDNETQWLIGGRWVTA